MEQKKVESAPGYAGHNEFSPYDGSIFEKKVEPEQCPKCRTRDFIQTCHDMRCPMRVESEKTDVPKEVTGFDTIEEHVAYMKGRHDEQEVVLSKIKNWDGSTNSRAGQLLHDKFGKELADLRAERDKLKDECKDWKFAHSILLAENERSKANSERLKEENDELATALKLDFTSELQRRWPSDEEIMKQNCSYDFKRGVAWLKSYLENK